MIPHERASLADSLWSATALPGPVFDPMDGDTIADVAQQ